MKILADIPTNPKYHHIYLKKKKKIFFRYVSLLVSAVHLTAIFVLFVPIVFVIFVTITITTNITFQP